MKRFSKWFFGSLLVTTGCQSILPPDHEMNPWRTYRTIIPHFFVEYKIPHNLTPGSGGQAPEVSFKTSYYEGPGAPFGDAAFGKAVANFYFGVVGDPENFDMKVSIAVLKFDRAKRPMKTTDDLAEYTRQVLSKPEVLKNGKELNSLGNVIKQRIGSFEVVRATSADLYHITDVTFQDGAISRISPFQAYLIRLDEEICLTIDVRHFTQKRLSPQWHADAEAMAEAIIQNLRIIPRPKQSSGLGGHRRWPHSNADRSPW